MFCPFCSSEYVVPGKFVDDATSFHCMLCRADFFVPSFDTLDEDLCDLEGHDWHEVEIGDGYTFDQCLRCGMIDG